MFDFILRTFNSQDFLLNHLSCLQIENIKSDSISTIAHFEIILKKKAQTTIYRGYVRSTHIGQNEVIFRFKK